MFRQFVRHFSVASEEAIFNVRPWQKPLKAGSLYVVSTPLGNSGDITLRALHVLSNVDGIVCENPRIVRNFLSLHGIMNPTGDVEANSYVEDEPDLITLPKLNPKKTIHQVLTRLRQGEKLAIVSDAGTPCISDPGTALVHAVRISSNNQFADESTPVNDNLGNVGVITVPGPSAITAALSISGFSIHNHYAGLHSRRDFPAMSFPVDGDIDTADLKSRKLTPRQPVFGVGSRNLEAHRILGESKKVAPREASSEVLVNGVKLPKLHPMDMHASNGFYFAGFIPEPSKQRKEFLLELVESKFLKSRVIVLYESSARLLSLLEQLASLYESRGTTRAVIINRELTKRFEESVQYATFEAAMKGVGGELRGEFTLVLSEEYVVSE